MPPSYTYEEIRQRIVTIIQGVSGAGQVHNRVRYSDNWQSLLNLFETPSEDPDGTPTVGGWMVTRTAIEPVDSDSHFGAVLHLHHIQLQGILLFSDLNDSDGQFQDLVDRIVSALEDDHDLWQESNVSEGTRRPTVNTIELRMFGRALGHYADLDFVVPTMDAHA